MGTGGALLASKGLPLDLSGFWGSSEAPQDGAKNIIFLVADGMAMQTISMADQFLYMTEGKHGYWRTLMNEDYCMSGLEETRSLSSIVTDSAAASSAWGSGRHIWNGQVNMFPDGTKLTPISHIMSGAGVRCGLVSTARITHATPAGFGVSVFNRDSEDDIATEYLTSGIDVLLGGGSRHFDPAKRKDKRDVYGDFVKKGYAVAKDRQAMKDAKGDKLVGAFWPSHVPYMVDWNNNEEMQKQVPTLAEMAAVALDKLKDSPKGFLLQIEGGRVDHAGHANDLAAIIHDQIAFEEAVKVAVDFALKDKNTLVIITTDHATGGPSLNGDGPEYFDSTEGFMRVKKMKASYETLVPAFGKEPGTAMVTEMIERLLGFEITGAEAKGIVDAIKGDGPFALSHFLNWDGGTMANILGNYSKVTWTGGNHTAEHCLVSAIGPGASYFHGLTTNITYFDHMLAQKGLKFSNPTMSFEDAQKAMDKAKTQGQVFSSTVL